MPPVCFALFLAAVLLCLLTGHSILFAVVPGTLLCAIPLCYLFPNCWYYPSPERS